VWVLGVVLACAVAGPAPARAGTCPEGCDPKCASCCKSWAIRAACENGKGVALQGAFGAWSAAKQAADAANQRVQKCSGPGPGCRDYNKCSNDEAAVWAPYCAPDQVVQNPTEAAAAEKELGALLASVQAQLAAADDLLPKLQAYGGTANLRAAAKTRATALSTKLTDLRGKLQGVREDVQRRSGQLNGSDSKKLRASHAKLLQEAADAASSARALMADASNVDTEADARARRQAEAEAASKARKEAADRAREEARAKKDAAEAEERARREEAARTAADDKARAESSRANAAARELEEATRMIAESQSAFRTKAAELSGFLARPNLTEAATAAGVRLSRCVQDLSGRLAAASSAADAAKAKAATAQGPGALARVKTQARDLGKETKQQCADVTALVGAPPPSGSQQPPSAPPPAPSPGDPSVPTCDILLDSAPGASGLLVSIDGGARVPLPAKVRLASGKHQFSVSKGKASELRSELILCGRVSRLELTEPK
jgi:hypothetical protein